MKHMVQSRCDDQANVASLQASSVCPSQLIFTPQKPSLPFRVYTDPNEEACRRAGMPLRWIVGTA